METTLRAILEKDIDSLIPEVLEKGLVFKEVFPIKSLEDFLLGYILGMLSQKMMMIIQFGHQRPPNDAEMKEFLGLIERRTMEIKGKIKLAMSK
jgi:hypothetical protein